MRAHRFSPGRTCSGSRRFSSILPAPLIVLAASASFLALAPLAPAPLAAPGHPTLSAQATPLLLDTRTRDLLREALSGETAKEYAIAISRFHRIQGSRGYRESANYVVNTLLEAGFTKDDAFIESFPSDGRVEYQTWQSPSGWDIERAELRMVEPYQERIAGFPEIAMSLMT